MKKKEFEGWLSAHPKGYSYSVIHGYPTECLWVEKHLQVDLDQEYATDRMASVLDRLTLKCGENPLRRFINGNLYNNLATYKRAVGSYIGFLDAGAPQATVGVGPRTAPVAVWPERQELHTVSMQAAPLDVENGRSVTGYTDLLRNCTVSELLALHASALDELRRREIVRSGNAPGGDYAELLFTRAFGWTRTENSVAGHDATDWSGRRYQIKSRRLSTPNGSRQLSALRQLPDQHFDYLAAVLFEKDYKVSKAAMIPHEIVVSRARFQQHTNSWVFFLDDTVWKLPDVGDVTQQLRHAAAALDAR
jgi:hypothetical protein